MREPEESSVESLSSRSKTVDEFETQFTLGEAISALQLQWQSTHLPKTCSKSRMWHTGRICTFRGIPRGDVPLFCCSSHFFG
jgi:hypothetical protein